VSALCSGLDARDPEAMERRLAVWHGQGGGATADAGKQPLRGGAWESATHFEFQQSVAITLSGETFHIVAVSTSPLAGHWL
jgi:hypothetical protein